VQDAPIPELEARLIELSQERDHFRKLYLGKRPMSPW